MARKKIALVGAGMIGGTLAHLCALKGLGDVALLDVVEGMPQGKALDLAAAGPVEGYDVEIKGSNDYADLKGADVCIVTAGVARKPGMSRDDLIGINAKIVKTVAEGLKQHAPKAFVIVVSNPLDAMVYTFKQISGFPKNRVVGMAGILDSARFRAFVAWELGVSVQDVTALVLGGHGDTMVPLVRYCTVAGIPVAKLLAKDKIDAIVERTKNAGGEVVALLKTGSAYFAPSAAAARMARAVAEDTGAVLPVCAWVDGEYQVSGVYLGVEAEIGAGGVRRVVERDLTDAETQALRDAAESVRAKQADVAGL
jgi:malate dehydrogenase